MEQYFIYILILCIGMIIGGILHRQTMTTPESREIDRQHCIKHTLLIEEHSKELNKLNRDYDRLISKYQHK